MKSTENRMPTCIFCKKKVSENELRHSLMDVTKSLKYYYCDKCGREHEDDMIGDIMRTVDARLGVHYTKLREAQDKIQVVPIPVCNTENRYENIPGYR